MTLFAILQILHESRVYQTRKEDYDTSQWLDGLRAKNLLYVSPRNMNDDMFWMYAPIRGRAGSRLVSLSNTLHKKRGVLVIQQLNSSCLYSLSQAVQCTCHMWRSSVHQVPVEVLTMNRAHAECHCACCGLLCLDTADLQRSLQASQEQKRCHVWSMLRPEHMLKRLELPSVY
jgi:hypothetical protein